MKSVYQLLVMLGITILFVNCNQTSTTASDLKETTDPENYAKPRMPSWVENATIYEVNLRQYTPEGTFKAFEAHLPRLKKMGVDILWFMPIHPISEKNRKGSLGSYYAVSDYKDTNPEHGTLDDFKSMVSKIHGLGMYIIIDWVPNHTGWDNNWINTNPEWYTQDENGNIIDPVDPGTGESWGWTDVADLNYDNAEMRLAMIDAMKFWIKDYDVDGFRCDVAHNVPVDFWQQATDSLYKIEPIFMLAEAEVPEICNDGSFAADYGWSFHHLMNDIFKGHKNANDIAAYLEEDKARYSKGFHMHFTSNHDENTWAGTVFDRMGDSHLTLAVLAATFDGMPLIYSGQEAANKKRLAFFEKDSIDWTNLEYEEFYTTLLDLKHKNKALWNGEAGGELVRISTDKDDKVFAFIREKEGHKVIVVLNLSKTAQEIKLNSADYVGAYNNVFAKGTTTLTEDMMMNLEPWDFLVLSNN